MDTPNSDISASKSSGDWQNLGSAAREEVARRNPNSLLDWALAYRNIGGGPMRLTPALKDLYGDDHRFIVVQKAAQVGMTEYAVSGALWVPDTYQGTNGTSIYVMPTQAQVNDFSQARVDRALKESEHLRRRISPPPPGRGGPVRQGLKAIGDGYLYLRGSDAQQLISVPADAVYLDEFDLMTDDVLPRALQRLAASSLGLVRVLSTPRYPEAGINKLFLESDMRYYHLKCPGCGRAQVLDWEHNVDTKRNKIVCGFSTCRTPMDLWGSGQWEAAAPGNDRIHGYHINRLLSPMANIELLVFESEATTPAAIREFQNSVLGETFVPPGGMLSIADLDACRREYAIAPPRTGNDMGVDVGTKHHVIIRSQPDEDGRTRLLFAGDVEHFEDLDELIARYGVRHCVVDAQPEGHGARAFAKRHGSIVVLAYYDRDHGDHVWDQRDRGGVRIVHANRTNLLEEMFERIHHQKSELPTDARLLGGRVRDGMGEYYREMMALTRALSDDNAHQNWVSKYENHGKADHFGHAEAYCLLASRSDRGGRLLMLRYV